MKGNFTASKIVLIVWLVFSILYVLANEYGRLNNIVAVSGYNRGMAEAAIRVINNAQECKAFDVTYEGQGVKLLNIDCLQPPPEGVGQPQG